MPIRDRVTWGTHNPFADPRLTTLDQLVRNIRQGRLPPNVKGGSAFRDERFDLPARPLGYYKEYDVAATAAGTDRGKLRLILGTDGDVYVTGNHYDDFRQIVGMPG